MDSETKTTTIQCLVLLKAAYPRQALPDDTIDLYEMLLADVDTNLLKTAVLAHVASSKWFPTVAELRESAANLIHQAAGEMSSYEAWGEVGRQMRRYGRWRAPELPPRIQQAVESIGGWTSLCDGENTAADRARFIAAYEQFQKRHADAQISLPAVRDYVDELASGRERVGTAVAQLAAGMNGKAGGR